MRLALIALFAGLTCLALPAQAQECGPLTRAFSLDLTPGPGGALYSVPIGVQGVQKQFLLRTGDWGSRLSREAATELKLNTRQANGVRMLNADGTVRNASLVLADLTVGLVKAPQHELLVMERSGPFDGQFSPDLMQNYDIELDFAGRKLSYFLTDHCPGRVVYWTTGFTTVDFKGWDNNSFRRAMTIPVTVDGHDVFAEVDTAETETILDADAARAIFSLTPDTQGAVPLGTLDNNPAHRMFGWTFKTLKIGGLTITNAKMRVVPDLIGTKDKDTLTATSRLVRNTDEFNPTVRIGMDVLRRLHLYVAAKERKLYITAASAPVPAPTPTPGAAPTGTPARN